MQAIRFSVAGLSRKGGSAAERLGPRLYRPPDGRVNLFGRVLMRTAVRHLFAFGILQAISPSSGSAPLVKQALMN